MTPESQPAQRRTVKYRGYEMILEDAETIAGGNYVTVGNWSFGQILDHLAKSFHASIDGVGFQLPWLARVCATCFLKGRFLNKTIPSGFQIPSTSSDRFAPGASVTVEEGLSRLRHAVHRCKSEKNRAPHPLFGRLPAAEWDRFSLRHAELHMSFVVPVADPQAGPFEETLEGAVPTHA